MIILLQSQTRSRRIQTDLTLLFPYGKQERSPSEHSASKTRLKKSFQPRKQPPASGAFFTFCVLMRQNFPRPAYLPLRMNTRSFTLLLSRSSLRCSRKMAYASFGLERISPAASTRSASRE